MADLTTLSTDPMGDTMITNSGDPNASPSPVTVDYYRQMVVRFQSLLNTLDPVYLDLQTAVAALEVSDDPDVMQAYAEGIDLLNQFESKRDELLAAAQAVNYASDGVNALGVQFPKLQYQGLSIAPWIAVAGVVGTAAVLIAWGNQFIQLVSNWIARTQQLSAIQALPADQQATVMQAFVKGQSDIAAAQAATSSNPLAAAGTLMKWGSIAFVAWLAWKAFKES